jgi:hypothetical protein
VHITKISLNIKSGHSPSVSGRGGGVEPPWAAARSGVHPASAAQVGRRRVRGEADPVEPAEHPGVLFYESPFWPIKKSFSDTFLPLILIA